LRSGAAPCHRAGCGRSQCCHQNAWKGQPPQRAVPLLGATQRHAIVPEVAADSAASSARERASSTSRPHHSYERRSAMKSCRLWPPTALPAACAKGPTAPAGLTSFASSAESCLCAGGDCKQALLVLRASQRPANEPEGQQHLQALHFLRAMRSHAIVQGVVTYRAVVSVGERGPAASAGLTSLACDAAPCLRTWCGYPQCRHQSARKFQQPQPALFSLERCGATPWCRRWMSVAPGER